MAEQSRRTIPARSSRRLWLVGVAVAVLLSSIRATTGSAIVNVDGWPSFTRFWAAAFSPELSSDFLRLTLEESLTTLAYAVIGTALSVVLGAMAAPLLSQRMWEAGSASRPSRALHLFGWNVARLAAGAPRSVHEILWALLLIQVYGPAPIVAIIAIGLPFAAVSASVFAETIDEADPEAFTQLRASGAGRLSALFYGVLPDARGDLMSYGFYRFECAIRSAAILGIIGAGGLGFQMSLSFQSLEYGEMWTLIYALMVLAALADAWSATARRSKRAATSLWLIVAACPPAWWWLGARLSILWDERRRAGLSRLVDRLLPPDIGPRGWAGLRSAVLDTLAMSILAIVLSVAIGIVSAIWLARPSASARPLGRSDRLVDSSSRSIVRVVTLSWRAIPPPVWAFLFILVIFPGIWPGALALGIYNAGIMARLFAETIEDQDPSNADALSASGAGRVAVAAYAWIPAAASRFVALSLYRWEVIVRETLVVGVVGASGLGRLIQEDLVARDFAAVTSSAVALMALTAVASLVGSAARRAFR